MNTKEAIELVEHAFCAWESEYCCGNEEIKALRDELKQVIIVIEQGEKYKQYKQIVDKLEYELETIKGIKRTYTADDILREINDIKQKYFPKELNESK